MNRIVRENYPVADLPEDLREGLPTDGSVRVTVEAVPPMLAPAGSFKELFALRRPPFRSMEDIVAEIRKDRDSWDD